MNKPKQGKASEKRPLGGGATPNGDRQPHGIDSAMEKESNATDGEPSIIGILDQDLSNEEREEIERSAFRRRPTLARSPTIRRTLSLPGEEDMERKAHKDTRDLNEEKIKRKRAEDSPTTSAMAGEVAKKPREHGKHEDGREKLLETLEDLIRKVDMGVAYLYSITSTSRNTRVEIKEEVERLVVHMKRLTSKDFGGLIKDKEAALPEVKHVGVQANLGGRTNLQKKEISAELATLEGGESLEYWREVAEKRWHEDLFKRTEVNYGDEISTARDSVVKVVLVSKEDDNLTNKKIWERFPELKETEETYAVLEQTTKIRASRENPRKNDARQKIIKATVGDSEDDLWDILQRVREDTRGDEWVAFQLPPGQAVSRTRKMVEFIFRETQTRVVLYVHKAQKTFKKRNEKKPKEERDTNALVVEGVGRESYTNILKKVKDKVKDSTAGGKIRGLRSTRDGKLLITMEKDEAATSRMLEILGETQDSLRVTKAGQNVKEETLHIRGMDALTSKQEVIEAIERRVGSLSGKIFRLSEMRPNQGETLAATVVLNAEDADSIAREGALRVGYVRCRVERRVAVRRCYRCWKYSHKARDCKEQDDKSKCCYKCGGEGHTMKNCDRGEYCPLCKETGHRADTRGCRVFRKALQIVREQERREGGENRNKPPGIQTMAHNKPATTQEKTPARKETMIPSEVNTGTDVPTETSNSGRGTGLERLPRDKQVN